MSSLNTVSLVYRSLDGKHSFRQTLGNFFADGFPDCAARGENSDYALEGAEVRESGDLRRGAGRPVALDAVVLRYPGGLPEATLAALLDGSLRPALRGQAPEAVSVR